MTPEDERRLKSHLHEAFEDDEIAEAVVAICNHIVKHCLGEKHLSDRDGEINQERFEAALSLMWDYQNGVPEAVRRIDRICLKAGLRRMPQTDAAVRARKAMGYSFGMGRAL
jgi:hypothetical protein